MSSRRRSFRLHSMAYRLHMGLEPAVPIKTWHSHRGPRRVARLADSQFPIAAGPEGFQRATGKPFGRAAARNPCLSVKEPCKDIFFLAWLCCMVAHGTGTVGGTAWGFQGAMPPVYPPRARSMAAGRQPRRGMGVQRGEPPLAGTRGGAPGQSQKRRRKLG